MKSIYGKLILGFLVSMLFSFSVAGYFSLRKNSDELGRLAVEELKMSSQHIVDLMELIDTDDLSGVLKGYSETSEISFFIDCDGQREVYGNITGQTLSQSDYQLLRKHIGKTLIFRDSSVRKMAKSYQDDQHTYIVFVQKDVGKREMIFDRGKEICLLCG